MERQNPNQLKASTGGRAIGGLWAARKGFYQADKLSDFADFFLKALTGQFPADFKFHNFGSFNLCC